jgi:dihydrofolate reductase
VPKVMTGMSTSVDGFIAGPNDTAEQPMGSNGLRLFDWFSNGDTASRFYPHFRMAAANAAFFDAFAGRAGAVISGRHTYDVANAWAGTGPLPGVPLFVLTHHLPEDPPLGDPSYTFVTDGIESAVTQAKRVAGEKDVSVMGSAAVQQCLQAGLLDELHVHLIPVVLGGGVRLLDHLGPDPIALECIGVLDGPGVTHLSYRVVR